MNSIKKTSRVAFGTCKNAKMCSSTCEKHGKTGADGLFAFLRYPLFTSGLFEILFPDSQRFPWKTTFFTTGLQSQLAGTNPKPNSRGKLEHNRTFGAQLHQRTTHAVKLSFRSTTMQATETTKTVEHKKARAQLDPRSEQWLRPAESDPDPRN